MNRSTWIFLLVASGLMAYLYFVEPKQKTTGERELAEKKLMEFTSTKVKRLELVNGDQRVVLTKNGTEWEMETPVKTPADNTAVEKMLSEIDFTEVKRTFKFAEIPKVDETLKEWGLQTPSIRLQIEEEGKKEPLVLLVGRKTAVTDAFYVRTSNAVDAPVFLVSGSLKTAVDKKSDELRSRSVWRWNTPQIAKILVKKSTGESTPVIENEAIKVGGDWKLQKPILARGDGEKIRSWLSQLASLQIAQFISEDSSNLNAYGLNTPVTQITLGLDAEGEEQTLLIGAQVPEKQEVYAKRLKHNTVFTLPQAITKEIADGAGQWRDTHVVAFNVDDISGIRIESAKSKPIVAKKTKEGWALVIGTNEVVAESDSIRSFLSKLRDLKSEAFVKDSKADVKNYGLDKPVTRIALEITKGEVVDKVEVLLGRTDKNLTYAMNSVEPFIVSVSSSALSDLPKDPIAWRDTQILSLDKNKITRFQRIEKGGGKYGFSRANAAAPFVEDGTSQTLDNASVESMLLNLCHLRATRWIGPVIPSYDLTNPAVRAIVGLDKEEKVIRVGATLPTGGRAAIIEGTDTVFEITLPDLKSLLTKPETAKPAAVETPAAPVVTPEASEVKPKP